MKRYVFGYHKKNYLVQLHYFAKRLGAEEMTVHKNGSVDLVCADGIICENYAPIGRDLRYHKESIQYDPRCDVAFRDAEWEV